MNLQIAAAAAVVVYFWAWQIVNYVWLRPRRVEKWLRAQGWKSNPYRVWYGDLKDAGRMTVAAQSKPISVHHDILPYVLPYHHHIISKYGKRSLIWHGPTPRIIVTEPDMIKEVLNKHEVFVKVYGNPLNKLLISGLSLHEGQKWAKHRRILNPAFTITKLKDMIPMMHVSCNELVKKWQSMFADKGSSHEIDVWPSFENLTADVISRTAFGSNYEQGKKVFLLQKEQAQLAVQLSRSVYIPGLRFLPTEKNKRMKEINREVQDVLRGIIQRREEAMRAGEKTGNDMLGILLESNSREVEGNGNREELGISTKEVIDECKLFYFAGQETTSNLLVWTMVMLSIHQNWQTQAREEVLQVFGKSNPDFDGLNQLKKVNLILHEVLRLYPPATTIARVTREKIKLGDTTLPAGTGLVLPILFIHHDKEIWGDDAKEFKPERFAQGVANATKGGIAAFFPFSLGPRICIGQNFAMVEAKLVLAMILQHFSFELSPCYEHAPVPVLTLQPKHGAKIMFTKI
ncbi:UNVERIFIED_CONTAM: cytochrome [Sesamum angustifolium]|uniref:Cytochrome n=1 Tax=Sesamum angustifolium TaxID=2727405 RepID=A0AAW2PFC3_9LAMI